MLGLRCNSSILELSRGSQSDLGTVDSDQGQADQHWVSFNRIQAVRTLLGEGWMLMLTILSFEYLHWSGPVPQKAVIFSMGDFYILHTRGKHSDSRIKDPLDTRTQIARGEYQKSGAIYNDSPWWWWHFWLFIFLISIIFLFLPPLRISDRIDNTRWLDVIPIGWKCKYQHWKWFSRREKYSDHHQIYSVSNNCLTVRPDICQISISLQLLQAALTTKGNFLPTVRSCHTEMLSFLFATRDFQTLF